MCGIVAAVSDKNIVANLVEGLKTLEYRGYDSAGLAVLSAIGNLERSRALGKVANLETKVLQENLNSNLGIAHTRWATHGKPSDDNAHPHISEHIALVHNGIIENYAELKAELKKESYVFTSETDSEVMVHLIHRQMQTGLDLFSATTNVLQNLEGAYAITLFSTREPNTIVCARKGSPLVIGLGKGENFCASDPLALLQVTRDFIYLEEGDIGRITTQGVEIYNDGKRVERQIQTWKYGQETVQKGEYSHFMQKEIFEQAEVMGSVLEGRLSKNRVLPQILGTNADELLNKIEALQIVACGTSFNAAQVAKYWIEDQAQIPCFVEIASEYRYRKSPRPKNCLFITVSQSGETADTLAALRYAKQGGYLGSLSICNVPGSSLARESDLTLFTQAGPEIGVASTKAFTSQLAAFLILTQLLAQNKNYKETNNEAKNNETGDDQFADFAEKLRKLPSLVEDILHIENATKELAKELADYEKALYLGRGSLFPIAVEGALKLKEISYIHAEAYPAGELKHGPLALVDKTMPVIALVADDGLADKILSNLSEVSARDGVLYVFADEKYADKISNASKVISIKNTDKMFAPIIFSIPLQLLAYHTAILKGTDVDQPRNLAKSVTVE